ncbi:MAG: GntR family transcriptional regulator [Paenibacillaceae bacterium]
MNTNYPFVLNKELLSDKVTNFIRKKILLSEFKGGSHLSEVELSKNLNVSRGPVRESIRQLEHEGLVHTPSNGRTIVIGFTQEDLSDLFDVRKTLEGKAIRTIIERGYQDDLSTIESIVESSKIAENRLALISLDVQFHLELVSLSRNRTLIKLWSVIRGLSSTLIEISTDIYERLDQVPEVHQEIIESIRNRDSDGTIRLLNEHLNTGEAIIRERLIETN